MDLSYNTGTCLMNRRLSSGGCSTANREKLLVMSPRRVERISREMKIWSLQKQSAPPQVRKRGRKSGGLGLKPRERDLALHTGHWRLFGVEVGFVEDPGKDDYSVSQPVLEAISGILKCSAMLLPPSAFSVVRKSLDARSDPVFVYTIDLDVEEFTTNEPAAAKSILRKLKVIPGKVEFPPTERNSADLVARFHDLRADVKMDVSSAVQTGTQNLEDWFQDLTAVADNGLSSAGQYGALKMVDKFQDERARTSNDSRSSVDQSEAQNGDGLSYRALQSEELIEGPMRRADELPAFPKAALRTACDNAARVVVVGGGPAGLFATLVLAEAGVEVTLLERGQPVESRGKDIGSLAVRRVLNPNSNFCFGEGGAGTWSDGKLTTRIGKNGSSVQTVLQTLVRFGAPSRILVDGKPHVGTDKLVRILRKVRAHMLDLGVKIKFGTVMNDLEVSCGRVRGVWASEVNGERKGVADSGELLNADAVVLAVGHSARDVYEKLVHQNVSMAVKPFAVGFRVEHPQEVVNEMQYSKWATEVQRGRGKLPVADYRLAATPAAADLSSSLDLVMGGTELRHGGERQAGGRSCFSFCMCPGGQVVLTSTSDRELCVNGMSYSNRSSRWANAALVVPVSEPDFAACGIGAGPLAGVEFQRKIEREAAVRGGGKFCCPVQRVTDFLDDRVSGAVLPSSSYRLGVKEAFLGGLLPSELTDSLKAALLSFDRQLPGFVSDKALLHGVETRTSSPVRIHRMKDTFESTSMPGLYPIGEGAGYAGGIVSAAVDGMLAGLALAKQLCPANAALQNLLI